VWVCLYVSVCVFVCMSVCVSVCLCVCFDPSSKEEAEIGCENILLQCDTV